MKLKVMKIARGFRMFVLLTNILSILCDYSQQTRFTKKVRRNLNCKLHNFYINFTFCKLKKILADTFTTTVFLPRLMIDWELWKNQLCKLRDNFNIFVVAFCCRKKCFTHKMCCNYGVSMRAQRVREVKEFAT